MVRGRHAVVVALLALAGMGLGSLPAPGGGQDAAAELPFRVPPGFVVERVAAPPLVEHPVMACFDDQGRLYVAESAGLNLRAADLLKQLPDSIRRLEDSDGDGRFDRFTVFADRLSFPQGVLWHDGVVYTCAPPSLWKLVDTNGDGVADQRQELVSKFHFIGNAADIHGPVLGPDGWLYWADGRHGHQIEQGDRIVSAGKAARIFRCRTDGSQVETVCGGGMDNPVEIAFTDEGEAFATVNLFYGQPSRLDAIIYCVEGGVFPYHPAYKELKLTGELLPPTIPLGWVAPSGLMRYRGTAFGADFADNLFSAQFNPHRVQRHVLARDGAGFQARTEDFLVAASTDFHATDVLEDADGSLLVIDTGGWFRIGCPTSQIAKPDIKGAIYRVRKKDAPLLADPRGLKIDWDKRTVPQLVSLLDDPRWAVRDRAIAELARRPGAAQPMGDLWQRTPSTRLRRNLVWAWTRIADEPSRAFLRQALEDPDESVRLAALHAVGLLRDRPALERVQSNFRDARERPARRRQAALALARIAVAAASADVVPLLLHALKDDPDRILEHAILYALIHIQDRPAMLKALADPDLRVRRGALIVLDQMEGGNLTRELVLPLLDTDDLPLQRTVWSLITARPDWAPDVIGQLRQWMARDELSPPRQEMLRTALLAFARHQSVQELVASFLKANSPLGLRLLLLEVIAQAPLDKLPPAWLAVLGHCLQYKEDAAVRQTVATLRARGVGEHTETLLRLAGDPGRSPELRVACLAAAAPRLARLEPAHLDFLVSRLEKDLPPLVRLSAAEALGLCPLDDAQLEALAPVVASAGALEIPHLLAPYERSRNPQVGKKLLAALERAPGLASLSPEALTRTLKSYPAAVRQAAEPLVKKLEVDTAAQKAKLDELEPAIKTGDRERGRKVFFSGRAACAACHTVGTEGGKIGPDLTKIGSIRSGRDLLEAVVFPSASFVRGFEPVIVATLDGRLHSGIIGRETADAVFLVTAERNEVRIPRSAVEAIDRAKVSIMPQGLDAQLSRQDLADLIAFMQSLR